MKHMFKKITSVISILALCLVLVGCDKGPLSRLDSSLDYGPFFFQGLVIGGKITQAQADVYKGGLQHLERIADETKECLSDNIKPDAQCYVDLGSNIRSALAQYYPASTEGKIAQFVALVQDVVNLIIKKNTPQVGAALPGDVDKQLENKIDALDQLLKSEGR
jgi:hypothetical protein